MACLRPRNRPLTFTWRKKTEDHHVDLPLRLRGSLTQLTCLAEDSTSIYAEANLEIVQGVAREVRIQLPEKVTINQVSGAMVADWEMKDGELAVTFLEPVEHSVRFVINGEAALPHDGIIDIPLLRLLNTERDDGRRRGRNSWRRRNQRPENAGPRRRRCHRSRRDGGEPAVSCAGRIPRAIGRGGRYAVAERQRGALRPAGRSDGEHRRSAISSADEHRWKRTGAGAVCGAEQPAQLREGYAAAGRDGVERIAGGKAGSSGTVAGWEPALPLEKSRGGEDAPAFEVEIFYLTKAAAWGDKGREKLTLPALDLPDFPDRATALLSADCFTLRRSRERFAPQDV